MNGKLGIGLVALVIAACVVIGVWVWMPGESTSDEPRPSTTTAASSEPRQPTTTPASGEPRQSALVKAARDGLPLRLVFAKEACTGSFVCGVPYDAKYDPKANVWSVHGPALDGKPTTGTGSGYRSEPNAINIWNVKHTFDDSGNLYFNGKRVGTIQAVQSQQ